MKNKKFLAFLFIFVLFVGFEILVMSGFCLKEMRYLSKREILDRYFWGGSVANMSGEEKEEMLEKRGLEYPDCCSMNFGNKVTFFSSPKIELTIVSYASDGSFKSTSRYVDCCGEKIRFLNKDNLISESINKDVYERKIKQNKKHWQGLDDN